MIRGTAPVALPMELPLLVDLAVAAQVGGFGAAVGANWPRLGPYWAPVGTLGGGDGTPLPVARWGAWGRFF